MRRRIDIRAAATQAPLPTVITDAQALYNQMRAAGIQCPYAALKKASEWERVRLVVSWTAELVVVKTSVQKKVFDLSLSSSSRPRFFLSRVWHCVLSFFCPLLSSLQQHTSCSVVPRTLWLLLVSLFRVRKSCCSSRFPGP